MIKLNNVAIAAMMLFGLSFVGGCQTSQSGSSTYAGDSFAMKSAQISRSKLIIQPRFVEEDADTYQSIADRKASIKVETNRNKSRVHKAHKQKRIISKVGRKYAKSKWNRVGLKSVKNKRNLAERKYTKSKRNSIGRKYAKSKRHSLKNRRISKRIRGRRGYDAIIRRHARANGIPYALARAVVQVESGFRASARGRVGEVGLMQIRRRTARGMGYRGSIRGLYNPETNIKYGMRYLGKAYRLGGRSTCGAILKYNAGHGAKRMNRISRRYCKKVRRIMRHRA